jgi:hypothetical protein
MGGGLRSEWRAVSGANASRRELAEQLLAKNKEAGAPGTKETPSTHTYPKCTLWRMNSMWPRRIPPVVAVTTVGSAKNIRIADGLTMTARVLRVPEAAVTSSAIVQASAVSYQLSRHDRRPRSAKTSVELEVARRTALRVPQHSYTSGRQENWGTHLPYLRRSLDA